MLIKANSQQPRFYDITLKDGSVLKTLGSSSKAYDDGALAIFAGNDDVIAAFAPGEWRSLSSKLVPMVTINTETGKEVSSGDLSVMSDRELGDAFCEAMGRG